MTVDFTRDVHCLLGLPFDAVNLNAACARVRRAAAVRAPCFLSTPNLNFLVTSLRDAAFRDSVAASDLSVMDGKPLVWLARVLGLPMRERVAGSNLFEALRVPPSDAGTPLAVYFFGAPPGAAAEACRRINAGPASMRCVGFHYPGFGTLDEMSGEQVIAQINASGADFLVVALGARKGQAWIVRNRARLTPPVVSHLGAVVNMAAGRVRQAPRWMQRGGAEWLWRIKEEPALWARYARDGLQLLRLVATRVLPHLWLRLRHAPGGAALARAAVHTTARAGTVTLRLAGAWCSANLAPLREGFAAVAAGGGDIDIDIDLGDVSHVDSAFLGLLMLLYGWQVRRGRRLSINGVRPLVRRVFKLSCADYMLHAKTTQAPPVAAGTGTA